MPKTPVSITEADSHMPGASLRLLKNRPNSPMSAVRSLGTAGDCKEIECWQNNEEQKAETTKPSIPVVSLLILVYMSREYVRLAKIVGLRVATLRFIFL